MYMFHALYCPLVVNHADEVPGSVLFFKHEFDASPVHSVILRGSLVIVFKYMASFVNLKNIVNGISPIVLPVVYYFIGIQKVIIIYEFGQVLFKCKFYRITDAVVITPGINLAVVR